VVDKDQTTERERRCIVSGDSAPVTGLIRLVMGPDDLLVPDIAEKLPGRGLWVSADAALITAAIADGKLVKGLSRSLKAGVKAASIPVGLADQIDRLLTRRVLNRLGLERRAGRLVTGFENVRSALGDPGKNVTVLLAASDGAEDGRIKLRAKAEAVRSKAQPAKLVEYFDREDLGQALGRENIVHAAVLAGGASRQLIADLQRLDGFRIAAPVTNDGQGDQKD